MSGIRDRIILEAREWLGTKFQHQGRIKNVGCDCIGLISGVLQRLSLRINGVEISDIDDKNYNKFPDKNLLEKQLDSLFDSRKLEGAKVGDIFLMKFFRNPQHVGFISQIEGDKVYIIHSYINAEGVVEQHLNENFAKKIIKIYNIEKSITA